MFMSSNLSAVAGMVSVIKESACFSLLISKAPKICPNSCVKSSACSRRVDIFTLSGKPLPLDFVINRWSPISSAKPTHISDARPARSLHTVSRAVIPTTIWAVFLKFPFACFTTFRTSSRHSALPSTYDLSTAILREICLVGGAGLSPDIPSASAKDGQSKIMTKNNTPIKNAWQFSLMTNPCFYFFKIQYLFYILHRNTHPQNVDIWHELRF